MDLQRQSEKLLREKFPEIQSLFGNIGTAEIAIDPMGAKSGDTYVEFRPRKEWRKIGGRPATSEQLIELMRRNSVRTSPDKLFSSPSPSRCGLMK